MDAGARQCELTGVDIMPCPVLYLIYHSDWRQLQFVFQYGFLSEATGLL